MSTTADPPVPLDPPARADAAPAHHPSVAPRPGDNPLREGLRLERMPAPCTMVIFGATGDLPER